jgi:hypothetical protein
MAEKRKVRKALSDRKPVPLGKPIGKVKRALPEQEYVKPQRTKRPVRKAL